MGYLPLPLAGEVDALARAQRVGKVYALGISARVE